MFFFFFFFFFFERESVSELCRARESARSRERENFTCLGFQGLGFLGKNLFDCKHAQNVYLIKSITSERAQRAAIIITKRE
jgi:hypothetical protein